MRVAIAGAGNVGRSIARELIANGHQVLLIEKDRSAIHRGAVPGATWLEADACELSSLEEAELDRYDVAIAATGDDKANLVHSLLAKTEFGVPRTVGRVNHPGNEWMFDDQWGVDVSVSTPRLMSALVEEAVSTGDLVRLLTFTKSTTHLSEIRLPVGSRFIGHRIRDIQLPGDAVLVAIIRDGAPLTPERDRAFEASDELLFLVTQESEPDLAELFDPESEPEES
ncbi:TrkA family potassium uptake protein [Tessaracoccus sp. MC1865]|uniref:potassium channel family protein n=1 Tax=unclassified Tessaracoccus TaxID=2635419 RepID=UPI00096EE3D5|nr:MULTISPECIES: TrkA family potassium uptake protein [unclassified Tessaracoccus]MBB1483318.1 TrkA family potassium uptake protein [Tessaracoccus sp. MC1865]MCG6566454.1 TrkA family potassium uptake protein [Tessaracoccus sp. ZS01]OMG58904.1 potassium transporter TrkA [Tessaracoccus sp. ZS01]QTO36435.1 TrkA family potassium uptake protein [Tessaracoccus sp. MC1865]